MKNLIYLSLFVFVMSGCEETIELDIEQTQPIYVVEGLVTNQMKNHYVKLTKNVGFYDEVKVPPVTNATIVVSDNSGNSYPFQYNSEDSIYYSMDEFEGIVDRVYSLNILIDDDQITASDTLKQVSPIEAVLWEIDEDERENPDKEGYFYEITLTAKEPKETVDYYLFHFYRNDTIQRFDSETGVFFADDVLVKEEIDNFPAPVYYKEDDTARFVMMSITRFGYEFYNGLSLLLNNDGGMFSSIPANPYTNLEGTIATGFFQLSSVDEITIVVGDPEFERRD